TVAMVYAPGAFSASTGPVQFIVYDANGNLKNSAQLDSTASNTSIPNNCLNCHGGQLNGNQVSNAHFLPFDPKAFKFSNRPGFTFNDFADHIRRLNVHVSN